MHHVSFLKEIGNQSHSPSINAGLLLHLLLGAQVLILLLLLLGAHALILLHLVLDAIGHLNELKELIKSLVCFAQFLVHCALVFV